MKEVYVYVGYKGRVMGFPEEKTWEVATPTKLDFLDFLSLVESKCTYELITPPYWINSDSFKLGNFVKRVHRKENGRSYRITILINVCHKYWIDKFNRKPEIRFFKMLKEKQFHFNIEDLKKVTKKVKNLAPTNAISLYAI